MNPREDSNEIKDRRARRALRGTQRQTGTAEGNICGAQWLLEKARGRWWEHGSSDSTRVAVGLSTTTVTWETVDLTTSITSTINNFV